MWPFLLVLVGARAAPPNGCPNTIENQAIDFKWGQAAAQCSLWTTEAQSCEYVALPKPGGGATVVYGQRLKDEYAGMSGPTEFEQCLQHLHDIGCSQKDEQFVDPTTHGHSTCCNFPVSDADFSTFGLFAKDCYKGTYRCTYLIQNWYQGICDRSKRPDGTTRPPSPPPPPPPPTPPPTPTPTSGPIPLLPQLCNHTSRTCGGVAEQALLSGRPVGNSGDDWCILRPTLQDDVNPDETICVKGACADVATRPHLFRAATSTPPPPPSPDIPQCATLALMLKNAELCLGQAVVDIIEELTREVQKGGVVEWSLRGVAEAEQCTLPAVPSCPATTACGPAQQAVRSIWCQSAQTCAPASPWSAVQQYDLSCPDGETACFVPTDHSDPCAPGSCPSDLQTGAEVQANLGASASDFSLSFWAPTLLTLGYEDYHNPTDAQSQCPSAIGCVFWRIATEYLKEFAQSELRNLPTDPVTIRNLLVPATAPMQAKFVAANSTLQFVAAHDTAWANPDQVWTYLLLTAEKYFVQGATTQSANHIAASWKLILKPALLAALKAAEVAAADPQAIKDLIAKVSDTTALDAHSVAIVLLDLDMAVFRTLGQPTPYHGTSTFDEEPWSLRLKPLDPLPPWKRSTPDVTVQAALAQDGTWKQQFFLLPWHNHMLWTTLCLLMGQDYSRSHELAQLVYSPPSTANPALKAVLRMVLGTDSVPVPFLVQNPEADRLVIPSTASYCRPFASEADHSALRSSFGTASTSDVHGLATLLQSAAASQSTDSSTLDDDPHQEYAWILGATALWVVVAIIGLLLLWPKNTNNLPHRSRRSSVHRFRPSDRRPRTLYRRAAVTALYFGYLAALCATLVVGHFLEAVVVCLSVHFIGLGSGLVVYRLYGSAWADPYPMAKLGQLRVWVVLSDVVGSVAWVFAAAALIADASSLPLLWFAGTTAFVGIFVCFAKFYKLYRYRGR